MILLDTTVLLYAVGVDHPLRDPCRRLLAAHGRGDVEASTTPEVIQEFVHVRSRRRSRQDATAFGRHYATALPLVLTEAADLDTGLDLYEHCEGLGMFDAVLAAVALNHGIETLVSADNGFAGVSSLHWVDPATEALDGLLNGG